MTVRPRTFDPLDAPLWEGYEYIQKQSDTVREGFYRRTVFWADPKNWERHKPPPWVLNLNWNTYCYSQVDTLEKLRNEAKEDLPGIYLFSIQPEDLVKGFPCYALYVGISNERNSMRPVRERLADYLPTRMSQIRKRNNIHRMLCFYFRTLWVYFAYVNEPSNTLSQVEKTLHGYLAPPVGSRDYPVEMKPGKRAF